jgi:hypothetical protein
MIQQNNQIAYEDGGIPSYVLDRLNGTPAAASQPLFQAPPAPPAPVVQAAVPAAPAPIFQPAPAPTVSDADILGWFNANPGANDQLIAQTMQQANVTPEQVARATGTNYGDVNNRYLAATAQTGYTPEPPAPPVQQPVTRTPDQIQQDIIDQERQRQSEAYYWEMANKNRQVGEGTTTSVPTPPVRDGIATLTGVNAQKPIDTSETAIQREIGFAPVDLGNGTYRTSGGTIIDNQGRPVADNSKTVNDLYASIGRSGMGAGTNQIDQGGFDYWKQKLDSGMTPEQVKAEFQKTVNQFLTEKPTDAYSKYVAPTFLKSTADTLSKDTAMSAFDRNNQIFETAQKYGMDDAAIDKAFGKTAADEYRKQYGTQIKDYITNTLADTTKSDFDKAVDIHNAATKYGLDADEVAKYSGLNKSGVTQVLGAYDAGLANLAKGWEAAKTTAGTDAAALSTAEANKAKTMLALQNQYKVSDEDLAKATGTSVKDVQAYLTPVKEAPKTLEGLLGDAALTGNQIKAKIEELRSNPAVSGIYGAALDKFAASAAKTYSGDYNRKQYDSLNPLAVDNVLAQLKAQQAAGTAQYYQGGALAGKKGGFGSLDAVTEDMAKNLVAAGITDIRQVGQAPKYEPVDVIGKQFDGKTVYDAKDEDGKVLYQYYLQPTGDEGAAQVKVPKDAKLTPLYGSVDQDGIPVPVDQSKVTMDKNGKPVIQNGTQPINKVTGEPLSKASNYGERTTDRSWSGTYKGAGNTGYDVSFDKNGNAIFTTHPEASHNMADFAPILAMASFIPGAAPFVAAINAAFAAQQGNTKGALLSALSAAGPLAGMAGASADTVANIGTASKLANVANAISNKDLLGTIMSGVSAASDKNMLGDSAFNPAAKAVGDFSTKDILGGVSLANALNKGDLATLANVGAQMSGSQDAITAAKGLTLVKALQSNNPMAIASAVQKMNTTQEVVGKAGGGLASLPGLIKNGNKNTLTDKTAFDGLNGSLVAKMLNQQPPEIRAALLKRMTQAA